MQQLDKIKNLLDEKLRVYHNSLFIPADPISVPHRFLKKQDIEIAGFFAAILAWGNRTTIINNTSKLMKLMDDAPHDFILHHTENDLKTFLDFKHRTFNATDLLYFIHFLQHHYKKYDSLEDAFAPKKIYAHLNVQEALIYFHNYFFSLEHPERTRKHISTPTKKSACKRINMYLRWMVRKDEFGVDFGLWEKLKPHQLICPLDVHVASVAYRLGLLPNEKSNWQNAVALTEKLEQMNPDDPVLYDYAMFSVGMAERL